MIQLPMRLFLNRAAEGTGVDDPLFTCDDAWHKYSWCVPSKEAIKAATCQKLRRPTGSGTASSATWFMAGLTY